MALGASRIRRRECLLSLLALGGARAQSVLDPSRLSVITDEAARSPQEAIAFARKFGLRSVELRAVPGRRIHYADLPEQELRNAARELRENGLRVSFFNSGLLKTTLPGTEPVDAAHWSPEQRAARLARHQQAFDNRLEDLRRNIRAAQILGASQLRVFAFLRVQDPLSLFPRIAEILTEMAAVARQEGVRLLLENETSSNVATSEELARMLTLIPDPAFGINWDPMNGRRFGDIPFPDGYRALPRARLHNVQIKGHTVIDDRQLLDWRSIFATLTADGYAGCFGLETHIFDDRLIEHSHECMEILLRIARGAS